MVKESKSTRNSTTQQDHVDLVDYLRAIAEDGRIDMRASKLAVQFTKVTGINACYGSVVTAAKNNGIELITNKPKPVKAPKVPELPVIDEQLDAQLFNTVFDAEALARIEAKLDLILSALGVS